MIRFFIQFVVPQAVLFGAERRRAQEYFVVPWTNTLAAVRLLVTLFDPGVVAAAGSCAARETDSRCR